MKGTSWRETLSAYKGEICIFCGIENESEMRVLVWRIINKSLFAVQIKSDHHLLLLVLVVLLLILLS